MFPGKIPVPISTVYFFNRLDATGTASGNGLRMIGSKLSLLNSNGVITEQATLDPTTATNLGVSTVQFATLPTWPTYPNMSNPTVAKQQLVSEG